ncbi:MAG: hypothetical protein E6Q97_13510 [Desulfurellales bacterium]|nr:MAG: hypothetical protein E6Q97_13510 [Desulfurellales bacterium]
MTIFAIFAILGLLAALRPLGVVSDGGGAGDAAGGDSGDMAGLSDADGSDAGQAGGAADPNGGPAGEPADGDGLQTRSTQGKPAALDPNQAAENAWAKARGKTVADAVARAKAGAAVPAGPAAGDLQKLAGELRVSPETLAKIPAEYQAEFLGHIDRYWNEVYVPQAQRVASWYGQLEEYTQKLQEFQQSDPYQVAGMLPQDPQLFEAGRQGMQGGQGGEAGGGDPMAELLARIKPEELDETSRALYDMNQAALQRQAALEQQLQQFGGMLGQANNRWQQYDQQQAAKVQEMAGTLANDAIEAADKAAAAHFGFDPKRHQAEYAKAETYLMRQIAAEGLAPTPQALTQAWIEALTLAGFDRLKAQRAKLAAGAAPPPSARAGNGARFDPDAAASRAWETARATA